MLRATKTPRARNAAATVDAIRWIVRLLRVSGARTIAESGLSPAQLFVLGQLGDGVAASLTELGARTLTDRTSVAAVVDRLEAKALVTREVATEDRRRAAVRITAAGRAVLARAPLAPTARLVEALTEFDDGSLAELARGTTRLAHALGAGSERPSMLFADEAELAVVGPAQASGSTTASEGADVRQAVARRGRARHGGRS